MESDGVFFEWTAQKEVWSKVTDWPPRSPSTSPTTYDFMLNGRFGLTYGRLRPAVCFTWERQVLITAYEHGGVYIKMLSRSCNLWSVAGLLTATNVVYFIYQSAQDTDCCRKWNLRESDKPYACPPRNSPVDQYTLENLPLVKWMPDWDQMHWTEESRQVPAGVDSHFPWRRIVLVRHGQYYGYGEQQGHLSNMGMEQARLIGQKLKSTNLTFSRFMSSSVVRARETAEVIAQFITQPQVEYSDLLAEGWPTVPEPPIAAWDPDDPRFDEDGRRLHEAYRAFIHRADLQQTTHSTELIVAHGNVIGNFVLRALQVSPERWLKLAVYQASITIIDIGADGDTYVRVVGDIGHLPVQMWTG